MADAATLAERTRDALGEAFKDEFAKILERAVNDQATPDAELRDLAEGLTRADMIRKQLTNLKTAYLAVAAAAAEIFGNQP